MAESIGKKIKTLRKGRGLTQFQFADVMECSRGTIANYETNRRCPSFAEIRRMSEYFGVSVDYFGVDTVDETFELLSRARAVLTNNDISKEERERIYKEIMKIYLEMS